VRVASGAPKDVVRAWLHEPGGQPFRNGNEQEGAAGDEAARFEVEAQDVVPGLYEVVAAAPPIANSSAGIAVHRSPLGIFADLRDGAPLVALVNHTAAPVTATVAAAVVGGAREEVLTGAGADTGSLAFELPAWVRRVEVDVRMPATDWARFTDFGVTLENADGSQIGQAPLNYAFGRLEAELPRQRAAGTATLKLYPGWADPGSAERWTLTARVRLYGDSAQRAPLAVAGNATVTIPAGTPESVRFAAPASPWPLPAGFVPLLGYTVTAGDGTPWRLTAPLVRARAPLMR
jgi:hypothetical protein